MRVSVSLHQVKHKGQQFPNALSERYRLLHAAAFGVTADDLFTSTAGFPPVPLTGAPIRDRDGIYLSAVGDSASLDD